MAGTILIILLILFLFAFVMLIKTSIKNAKTLPPKKPMDNLYELQHPLEKFEHKTIDIDLKFNESITCIPKYLFFDIETTGLPKNRNGKIFNLENWPRVVQLAWLIMDEEGRLIKEENYYIKLSSPMQENVIKIHGITNEFLNENGTDIKPILQLFKEYADNAGFLIAHNIEFDLPIVESENLRAGLGVQFSRKPIMDTMFLGKKYFEYKAGYPRDKISLADMTAICYTGNTNASSSIRQGHDAFNDVRLMAKCFFIMKEFFSLKYEYDTYFNDHGFDEAFYEPDYFVQNKDINDKLHSFFDKKIVITGIFEAFSRDDIQKFCYNKGAILLKSVLKNTDIVIMGNDAGPAKINKILDLQSDGKSIKIIREKNFIEIYEKG